MKTHNHFYFVVSVMLLLAILLILSTIILSPGALAASAIPFIKHTIDDLFGGATSVYVTDMDGDGDMDVLGAAGYADNITWWENDSNENFTKHTIDGNFDGAWSVYATDLDGDGDVDVLGAAYWAGDIAWWENDGSKNFTKRTITDTFSLARSVYATDVDGDGDTDILGAAEAAHSIAWWENDGNKNFSAHVITNSFLSPYSVYAADVDGDGDVDILGAAYSADDIAWWENDGNENFTAHIIDGDFDGAGAVYARDLDRDGDIDVLGAAITADDIAWWENDGNENFTKHIIDYSFDGACSVYATDVDGDGDVDVLGAAWQVDEISWWENDGNMNFTKHTIAGDFDAAWSVYATDLDSDGDMDILGAAYMADDITWWEQPSRLSIGDVSVTEGDSGSVNAVFSVTLSITSTKTITVEYATANGSATAPTDYTAIPTTTLIFAPGVSTQLITVSIQSDTIDEPNETFWVNLANPVNASLGDAQGQGAILDDDLAPAVSFSSASYSVGEGTGSATITVTLSAASGLTVTVDYATSDNTATAGSDYTAVSGTLTFAPGVTSRTFTVAIANDTLDENDETVNLELNNPTNGTLLIPESATLTILDNDDYCVYLPLILRNWPPIPDAPVLDPISNPDGDGNYTVSWSSAERAESYTLHVASNADFTNATVAYQGTNTSHTVSGQPAGTYYYRVKATNSWGDSGWSNAQSVQVGPPDTPVLNPISNPDGDGSYTVSWNAANGAQTYTLEEDDNSAFSSPTTAYSGSGISKSISGKNVGTYYYRVRASNGFGNSSWSNVASVVVTVPPPPCSPTPGNWSGTGSGLVSSVSFTVSSDSSKVTPFSMSWSYPGACGHASIMYFVSQSITADCRFSGSMTSGSATYRWTGSFTTSSTATGTWSVTDGTCSTSGTWQATGP